MCMYTKTIKGINPESVKSELVAGFRKGYKVISEDHTPIFMHLYGGKEYKLGENVSNRNSKELTNLEKNNNCIDKGFHIYLNIYDALRQCCRTIHKEILIEVFYKDEDVVAYGHGGGNAYLSANVVVTKLSIRSLKDLWYPYLKE